MTVTIKKIHAQSNSQTSDLKVVPLANQLSHNRIIVAIQLKKYIKMLYCLYK